MARTHRKRPRKTVTLDRFLSFTSSRSKTSSSQEEKTEKKGNGTHVTGIMEKKDRKGASIGEAGKVEEKIELSNKEWEDNIVEEKKADEEKGKVVDIIDDLFEALLVSMKKVERKESGKEQKQKVEVKKTESSKPPREEGTTEGRTSKAVDKAMEEKIVLGEIKIPRGEIIDRILQEGISPELTICNPESACTDGRRLGEYFVDQFGFRRQRGFVRTTRTPVFTDWIVEEAVVSKLLPRAFKLETNRGALAIVPEDFICELQARYGVILKNFDACKGYQVSLTGTVSKSRKKK